jgi:hypothetical protein
MQACHENVLLQMTVIKKVKIFSIILQFFAFTQN